MQPQTVSEVITQHYVNSPLKLNSEFKPRKKFGSLQCDIDDTIEQDETPTYVDLVFEGIGAINSYFREKLSVVRKNVALIYQLDKIKGPVDEISRNFRISGVTRRQLEEATEWALKHYQLNVGLEDFSRVDLPNLGIRFIFNTGNFDYPVKRLVGHYNIKVERMYYSRIVYSNDTEDGVIVEIIPNVLWNKQAVNELIAQNFGLPHQALITMAESPKYEKYLPIISGLAIWVDPEANKFPVSSRVNLYKPRARKNMRELTQNLANWEISLINRLRETENFQEKVLVAIEEIKRNESELESDDSTQIAQASLRIANESKKLLERVKRHNPSTAERMERYIYIITAEVKTETRKSYAHKLISEVESTFAEYYKTEELRKEIDRIKWMSR